MNDSQKWLLLAGIGLVCWLLYQLAPVLTPFLASALLAYLGDPVVDRLGSKGCPRTAAVLIVYTLMFLGGLGLLFFLLPIIERQVGLVITKLPLAVDWLQAKIVPHLEIILSAGGASLDSDSLREIFTRHWQQIGTMITELITGITRQGQLIAGWLTYLLLIPVITFYLLRDWRHLLAAIHALLPRSLEATVTSVARDIDAVLAEFLRGQLAVMAALGFIYSVGLWMIGLDLSILIGLVSGLLSFVPYLGFIVGLVAAVFAAILQYHDFLHPLLVLLVFAVGQAIEGMVLAPYLVGERIGLHPVAVIFAVLAGGQLFGFLGVLLALPVGAVIVVLLRHARKVYLHSGFYLS